MTDYGNYEIQKSSVNVSPKNYNSAIRPKPNDTLPAQLAGEQHDSSTQSKDEIVSCEDNCKITGEDGKKYTGSKTVVRKSDGTLVTKIVYTDKSGKEVSIEESSKDENYTFNGKSVTITRTKSTTKYGGKLHSIVESDESRYHLISQTTVYEEDGTAYTTSASKMKIKACKVPEDIKKGLSTVSNSPYNKTTTLKHGE